MPALWALKIESVFIGVHPWLKNVCGNSLDLECADMSALSKRRHVAAVHGAGIC